MDLPTYTNIWRIEKRLYKLYDLRLPMPLPLVQIGVFFGIFVPWIVLLQLLQVPFHTPWHVVYIVPPGVLTWLATRPVIEGKRLTELMISQIRYLTEAKTWARLTPIREPDEVAIVGRVWLRHRGVSGQVHAGREGARKAQPAMEAAPAAPAERSAPPLHDPAPVRPAVAAAEAPSRQPAGPARPQRPSLRPTPHDGTATVSPAAPSGGRGARRPGEPWSRPGAADPWATRVDDPNATRTDNPRMPVGDDPNATRVDARDPRVTRPESVRRESPAPAPERVRGFPAPAARPADGGSPSTDEGGRRERPAAPARPGAPATGGTSGSPGTPHRTGRRRPSSHEPERPAASTGPQSTKPAPPAPRPDPLGSRGVPPALGRPATPAATGRPGESTEAGRSPAPSAPSGAPGRPDEPTTPGRSGASHGESAAPSRQAGEPGAPSRPDEAEAPSRTPSSPPAGMAGRHAAPEPGATPGPAAENEPDSRAAANTANTADTADTVNTTDAADAESAETVESTPTAPVIRLVPGRHAKSGAGGAPAAHEPPAPAEPSKDRDEPAAEDTEAARAASDPAGDDATAEARTDEMVWPARGPRDPGARPGTDEAEPAAPAIPSQAPPPGPFARPGGQTRGRSHGEQAPAQREGRPSAPAASTPPAPQKPAPQKPAPRPADRPAPPPRSPAVPPAPPQRPAPRPGLPPKAPAAGPTPPAQVPPTAPPKRGTPARPSAPAARAPQAWAEQPTAPPESPARGVRSGPVSPVRPGPMPQSAPDQDGREDDSRGLRRIFSGGGQGDGDYEQRVRTAFDGARRVVVLGCTGGAGQTVTGLMLGHTFAQHRGDRIVAVDVNPGPGAMARRTRTETRETLTSLITHAEQVTGYQMMRRYTSMSKSGLEVVAAGKNPVQALDDRDYALAMRTLDRFYAVTLLDAAAAVVARVLPYADQIVLVAPASSDAPRAVAMTFEWLDGHGYEDLRSKAVTVINGVSRRSMEDVEQAESVARGRCRALVRIPWDDHLSIDRAPRNELRTLRASTRKAYIALGGVVAGGLVPVPDRYPRQEASR